MDKAEINTHITRLHQNGIVDMHFDLLMDLYEKRHRAGVLGSDYWAALSAGNIGVVGVAIFLEDKYLPEMALRVALGQVARLYEEVSRDDRFAICRSYVEITTARDKGQIAFVITMEGVEPLGNDPDMLRAFYELGVRSVGLTHARRNMAGDGGVFAPSGSSPQGLTRFGKEVIRRCEELGILIDLAHLNPAGVEDVLALTTRPPCITHTNARTYYDIERNSSDAQLKAVAERGGVIGVNAVLVSGERVKTTLDHYVDHIEHIAAVAGMDHVGIGFDFFEFIYKQMPQAEKEAIRKLADVHFIPDLTHHGHAPNLIKKLIERGFSDADIEKVLWRNWMSLLAEVIGE